MIALAGCGGGGGSDGQPSAPPGVTNRAALVEAANCMRTNGFPNFPDPVEVDGRWVFPSPAANPLKVPPPCEDLFRRAGALGGGQSQRTVTAEEITKLRKWADCMRANSLPNWPDPGSDGVFRLPPGSIPLDDPLWKKADEACRPLEPGPIQIDVGPNSSKGR